MRFRADSIIFQNGNFVQARETDPVIYSQTMHYGYGVFEGVRAYETVYGVHLFKAKEHFSRLLEAANRLQLRLNYTAEELSAITLRLLEMNDLTDAYVRPLVIGGDVLDYGEENPARINIMAWRWDRLPVDKPLHIKVSSYQRAELGPEFAAYKVCGQYVSSVLARREAQAEQYDDALLLDAAGNIAEGSSSNIFVEKDDILYTPPAGRIIPGITRKTIIELARELGLTVKEAYFGPEFLYDADGAFFTGTTTQVAPVGSVDGRPFRLAWEDTMGYMLLRKYRRLVTMSDTYQCTLI